MVTRALPTLATSWLLPPLLVVPSKRRRVAASSGDGPVTAGDTGADAMCCGLFPALCEAPVAAVVDGKDGDLVPEPKISCRILEPMFRNAYRDVLVPVTPGPVPALPDAGDGGVDALPACAFAACSEDAAEGLPSR